jgi:Tfp pilus assembly ATPase PilU
MIEKISKPIRFDKDVSWLVVARDGEKFYVASEETLREDPDMELIEMGSRSLLQWAMEYNYPLRKFIKLQKLLVEKYFGL